MSIDLFFHIKKTLKDTQEGKLTVTTFLSQSQPAVVVESKIGIDGAKEIASAGIPLMIALPAPGVVHIKLTGGALRPAMTYKGTLLLSAGEQTHRWEVTLTTGVRGILAVEPVGTLKVSTFPFFWNTCLGSNIENCKASIESFSVTLRDKSESGPYHRVRVRFEPSGASPSKVITSNFTLDTLSFWGTKDGNPQSVDLEQRDASVAANSLKNVDLDYRGQRTLVARIKPLSPGEYSGGLRFVADESSDDALEAKLPLTIQVRHHWLLPVVVILVGSLVGWFSSKYVVGVRKSREIARQVKELQARADYLARPAPSRSGWEFSSEATSYGLARVRVMLSQLANLSSSAFPILVHEQVIQQQRSEAELRLSALESLRDMRELLQPLADGRPAAQLSLGHLLHRVTKLLDQPMFSQAQQAELAGLLQTAKTWTTAETRDAMYREALAERCNSQEIPVSSLVQILPQGDLRQQLEALLAMRPDVTMISDPSTTPAMLQVYDETLGKLALLWRERDTAWGGQLAMACADGRSLEELFRLVDEKLWETLDVAAKDNKIQILRDLDSDEELKALDIVEVHMASNIPGVSSSRILYHPLHISWRINPPDGKERRTETHGLTLVQYFPRPGKVEVKAVLQWQGLEIPVNAGLNFEVALNPEYVNRRMFTGGITEWAVIAVAAGFAIATAMGTIYDATFGSFNQYLTLFIWAAGAGTGGNIFKQLGTSSTPGGQSDVQFSMAVGGSGK